ncbi:MAG: amino acid adenylation domain-containing protein [Planctomycetota bacterium]
MTESHETADLTEGFRLSPQQRQLWRVPGDGAATLGARCCAVVTGPLDRATLQRAVDDLVRRHEILRTSFRCLPGTDVPVQVVDDPAPVPVAPLELDGDEAGGIAAALDALPAGAAAAFRVQLATLGAERHLLVLTLPALCADALGIVNALRELAHSYEVTQRGESLNGEAMQYADLAEWQNELLEEGDPQAFRWSSSSADVRLGAAATPGTAPQVEASGYAPRCVRRPLPAALSTAIDGAPQGAAATLLAAWAALLHRLTYRDELVIGVSGAGRSYEGLDTAIGLFARDLPITARGFDGSFDGVRQQLATALEAALEQQEYFSLERATQAATDYFPLGFAFEERRVRVEAGGLAFAVGGVRAFSQRSDARLVAAREDDELVLELHYDAARFDAAQGEGWLAGLEVLLQHAVASPAVEIAELELASPAERRAAVARARGAAAEIDAARCVHRVIEGVADATPEAVAVVAGAARLTYAELDARANQLAHRLRAAGAEPNTLIGLCAERSPAMVVGMLAVLKAGAGYLPLDPAYPADRLEYLVRDSGAVLLLAQDHLRDRLPAAGTMVLSLDARDETPAARPSGVATPDDLCYVIYTSGSTGKPKGVEIAHRNLVHSTSARAVHYDVAPGRFLLLSSYAFDSSVAGIYWTLCSGGTLVLPGDGQERDLHAITTLIATEQVTHTLMLPSLWGMILRETDPAALQSLQCVVVAGEACTRDVVELHHERLGRAQLWNEYGPTEATVWATAHRCDASIAGRVPIGRPIAGALAFVLDRARRPVPAHVAGELYLGGPGLARGYLGRPELTADRFATVSIDAGGDEGASGLRLYRTGDLVRSREDGVLEFLGRVDHQVKIRGHRIELEEIEQVLSTQPDVREAAVAAHASEAGDLQLVGYVVGQPGQEVSVDAARAFCSRRCRTTWCRVGGWCWTRCRWARTAKSTARRCRRRPPSSCRGRTTKRRAMRWRKCWH